MLKEIIRKEILEHLLGLRFAIACVLCLTVTLTSIFVRGVDYTQNVDDYHQNVAMDKQALEQSSEPWHLIWRNTNINLKPNPMKIFIQGIEEQNGGIVTLKGNLPAMTAPQDILNPSVPLFPFVDMVFFVGVILSLMAIVFGYNAISGEKENGTLRLIVTYSIPRDQLLLGKWIGGYITLIIPFLLSIIGVTAILMMQSNIDFDSNQWIRYGVFLIISLIFLASIFSLSIWISTITHRSSTSIIILVALWVVLILALPNLSTYASSLLGNTNPTLDINKTRMSVIKSIWEDKLLEKENIYDKENNFGPNWWLNFDWSDTAQYYRAADRWLLFEAWEKESHLELLREFDKLDIQYGNDLDSRIRLSKWISRISPFSCLTLAATELSGEGISEQSRKMKRIKEFHKDFITYTYDEILKRELYYKMNSGKHKMPVPWASTRNPFPKFTYSETVVSEYIKPVLIDTAILICFTILFFMLSFTAFLRYDVR